MKSAIFPLQSRRSSKHEVRLRAVNTQTRGVFKCEVVGERPAFQSVSGEAYMEVIGP